MRSSYIQNNYGPVFKNHVLGFKPGRVVELGVLDGYSTIWLAMGVRERDLNSFGKGSVDAYDLWDKYLYNHGNKGDVQSELNKNYLSNYVKLYEMDAYEVHKQYTDLSVDMIHIDISNDGDVFDKMLELWHPKMRFQSVFMFEGGIEERDKVDWMIKYNKRPIKQAIEANPIFNKKYIYGTYLPFPGLTIGIKKVE